MPILTELKTKYTAFATHHKALHTLLALLLVVLLSAALTAWRHNGSTYLTGQWDDASQALVYGRMLQMQQNESAPGGFMGVYTAEWGDVQNRYLYRDNTPVAAEDYMSYTHQSGLQGLGFGYVNKLLSVFEDEGEVRETMLYTLNSVLFYAATLAICLAVWRGVGLLPAALWLAAAVYAPWVQRGMKDLYWCLWTWLLPMLAAVLLCRRAKARGKAPWWAFALVFAACFIRCMCGFEFISTLLILCELPLVYCWAQALVCGNGGAVPNHGGAANKTSATAHPARLWFARMAGTGAAALGGVAAALLAWLGQGGLYYGSLSESWQNIFSAASSRVSISDSAVRDVTVGQVVAKYLLSADPVLQLGGAGVTVLQLLGFGAAALAVTAVLLFFVRRSALPELLPLGCVWLLSFAAPVSWMVLSKAHADVHVQLIPMLWNFAFVPVTCMMAGVLALQLWRAFAANAAQNQA